MAEDPGSGQPDQETGWDGIPPNAGPPPGYGAQPGYGYGGAYGGYYGRPPAPKPGIIPLRPLSLGEILDGAFGAIRWNPKAILIPSAIVAAITGVLLAVGAYLVERGVLGHAGLPQPGSGQLTQAQAEHLGATGAALFAVFGVSGIVGFFGNAVLTGFVTGVIGQAALGRKETLTTAWRNVRSRIGPVIAAMLLEGLFLGLGLAAAIGLSVGLGFAIGIGTHLAPLGVVLGIVCGIAAMVFAIIVTIRWSFIVPAVVLEHAGPVKAMGRSWRLVRGSWWRVWGILFLTQLIVGIAGEIIRVPFSLAGGGVSGVPGLAGTTAVGIIVSAIGGIIAGTVTAPLTAGVTVLLYTDLRMRREGMDITLQAAAGPQHPGTWSGGSQPPAGPPPAPGFPPSAGPGPGGW